MYRKFRNYFGSWRYQRLAKNALVPFPQPLEELKAVLRTEGYSSQCGQDKWVVETLLPEKEGGVFVDIGAHDGVTFSNTLYLERQKAWSGLAIEPIPIVFQRLRSNRSCCCVNACVGAESKISRFQVVEGYAEMLSGLVDSYQPEHQARIAREIGEYGGTAKEIEVQCFALNELLGKHHLNQIDYLSLDIEGGELEVLRSLDLRRFEISVIGVENNYRDYRIPEFMLKNGYVFHSVVGDEFYVRAGRACREWGSHY